MKKVFKITLIIFIFISGYICGKIGIDKILSAFILNLSQLDLIQIIGFSSSIATLLLFIAYFIGKYFIIRQMTDIISEKVDLHYDNNQKGYQIIHEYDLGESNDEQVYLYSTDTLKWIKIYEYIYDEKKSMSIKGKLVLEHKYLRNGFAIKINTRLPCGSPNYVIEYQRRDFIIGKLELAENGKNGLLDQGLSVKHTFKSILYYLVKS